jgi:MFS superfamily sulfate permease-like transporter
MSGDPYAPMKREIMLNLFANRDQNIKNDVLSGIAVALVLVPEAVAFAFVAGVSSVIGLYSAGWSASTLT